MSDITIHNTDVFNWLENYKGAKFHGVISDPPYGLAFMGKGWDKFKTNLEYQKWVTEWGSLLIQHLYPGAVCMFFGGTRTYHRLATGLEDAGFEIFDSMMFLYGSGFPKATDISKGIDKKYGLEREIVGGYKLEGNAKTLTGNNYGGHGNNKQINEQFNITKPNHPLAQKWNGYKTCLKPAYEPVILCRKPRGKETFVDCALNYGTGGLNIDGCRIGDDIIKTNPKNHIPLPLTFEKDNPQTYAGNYHNGRFPANFGLICDCEKDDCECIEKELDNNSGYLLPAWNKKEKINRDKDNNNPSVFKGFGYITDNPDTYNNTGGGASKFFYTAKSSRKERNLGLDTQNNHPTVKPIKLTEYLSKMILPPIDGSSILIPFSGSGSEIIGAMFAGWNIINALEISDDYVQIAEDRVKYWKQYETYEQGLKG